MNVHQDKVLKLTCMIFWEISCFEVLDQKGAKMGPKCSFSSSRNIDTQNFSVFLQKVKVS